MQGGCFVLVGGWVCRRCTRRGGVPGWLAADLAAALPGGGRARLVGGWVCRRCTRRGVCLLCRLPAPPLACFPAPLPRRGRIDPQPALAERSSRRHLLSLPRGRGPSQTPKFLSPGPPSPWLPALPIERRFYRFCAELAIPKAHPPGAGLAGLAGDQKGTPPADTTAAGQTSAARVQSRGCKGRSPLHKKTLNPPFPVGEGGRGDGGRKSS